MESTDRETLGEPLWNTVTGPGGGIIPSTPLMEEMRADDVVFHYYKPMHAIIARSRVATAAASHEYEDAIEREIADFEYLLVPARLEDVRANSAAIFAEFDRIKSAAAAPYFLPFVPDGQGGRPPRHTSPSSHVQPRRPWVLLSPRLRRCRRVRRLACLGSTRNRLPPRCPPLSRSRPIRT
jgi:hypothetical protein